MYNFLKWGKDWSFKRGDIYFWGILRISSWTMYGWMRSPDPYGNWHWIFRLGPLEYRRCTKRANFN
jgi:hypothetical protein